MWFRPEASHAKLQAELSRQTMREAVKLKQLEAFIKHENTHNDIHWIFLGLLYCILIWCWRKPQCSQSLIYSQWASTLIKVTGRMRLDYRLKSKFSDNNKTHNTNILCGELICCSVMHFCCLLIVNRLKKQQIQPLPCHTHTHTHTKFIPVLWIFNQHHFSI